MRNQTHEQAAAIRNTIRRMGVPMREEWRGDAYVLTFKIGVQTFTKHVAADGSVS